MIDTIESFLMNWVVGLPVEVGKRLSVWWRPIFLLVSLVWIPVTTIVLLPLLITFVIIELIIDMWKELNE